MMSDAQFFDVMRAGLWVATTMAFPILSVALVTGLAIGLFQALTSVQEMTLTFVPKLAAIAITFWVCMGFMTQTLTAYFKGMLIPLISGG